MLDQRAWLAASQRDQDAIDNLLGCSEDTSEWIACIAFYKALHLVEALLARDKKRHQNSHVAREKLLKASTRYESIYKHYRPLWRASMVARYLHYENVAVIKLSADHVRSELLDRRLAGLQELVSALI
ncbi:hypothetical protein LCGC14_1001230 [marine sediment metagenome]|uniref:HEPN domain-containing protein n=1 Tax=marine sediment metagenome TaxID=412755 RepID=A0A0F9NPF5_9ZZZZ